MIKSNKKILYIATARSDYWRVKSFSNFIKELYPNSLILVSNKKTYLLRYMEVFLKLLPHLIKINKEFDILFLGYMSQITLPLLKIFWKGPIISDFFLSLYDTIILDRKKISKHNLLAKFILYIDKFSINKSSLVIFETRELVKHFEKIFGLKKIKNNKHINIGANEKIFKPSNPPKFNSKLIIAFHGSFIPLQGIETIIKAAKILENKNINFQINLIGYGQTHADCKKLADGLKLSSVNFLGFLSYKKLINIYKKSHIGLGIFGTSDKAKNVISNKVNEILALKRLLITSKNHSSKKLLNHLENAILVKPGNPTDLANAIIKVYNNPKLIFTLSKEGYNKYKKELSSNYLKNKLKIAIESI